MSDTNSRGVAFDAFLAALAEIRMSDARRKRLSALVDDAIKEAVAAHDPAVASGYVESRCAASFVTGYRDGVREARRRVSDIAATFQSEISRDIAGIDDAALAAAAAIETASSIKSGCRAAKEAISNALDMVDSSLAKKTT